MDRHVILVDVGYLLAEGGKAYCDVFQRSLVRCDHAKVALALEEVSCEHSGLPLLRSYWYDGAPDYVPTPDHLAIAGLPRVKLRLGRIVQRRRGVEQKGVDSLLVHDMITLAHERAVATTFLLAGDEDLREGVAAAQRLGVQVIVLGIRGRVPNQSLPLIREADEHIILKPELLQPFFRHAGYQPGATAPLASEAKADPKNTIQRFAGEFARGWIDRAEPSQIGDLLARKPKIPQELDVQLLVSAEEALGIPLRGEQEMRYALRGSFWEEIELCSSAKLSSQASSCESAAEEDG